MHCSDPRDSLNFASSPAFLAISFHTLLYNALKASLLIMKKASDILRSITRRLSYLPQVYIGMSPIVTTTTHNLTFILSVEAPVRSIFGTFQVANLSSVLVM